MHEVWITGVGVISALGKGMPAHSIAVRHVKTGLAPHNLFNGEPPDPCICGKVSTEVIGYDIEESAHNRANILLQSVCEDALNSAGLITPVNAELIAGTTLGNMHGGTQYYRKLTQNEPADLSLLKHFLPCAPVQAIVKSMGITGKHWTIASACGSATAAIGHAFHRIRHGKSDIIMAGGFEALSPFIVAGFNCLQLVSKEFCKPFDAHRNGLNPGEGAAMFILESAASAQKRDAAPLAKIIGFGDALDAYHFTAAHPEGAGLVTAIREALNTAGKTPVDINHIHLHGTGTRVNDNSEYNALKTVFGNNLNEIPACSSKSMTGHTFGASGGLSTVFSIIAMLESIAPATLFHDERDTAFEDIQILKEPKSDCKIDTVLSNSLGFGGEAFALVLTKAGDV